ncbi:MAG: ankyrin repeat domain-containing protein [Planctomycetota bacterium]
MHCQQMRMYFALGAVFLCGLLIGCKDARQVGDLVQTMRDPRAKGPMHERLKWKAEEFFDDAGVIRLCRAIEAKDLREIERLAQSGVNVNAKGRGNMTPLLWAFPMGEKAFRKLLELGADPNVRLTESTLVLREGKSVTFAAVKLVDGPIYNQFFYDVPMDAYLSLVLKHDGDPNQEDCGGQTPLFDATLSDPRKVSKKIDLLLDAGGDVNYCDQRGYTALLDAPEYRFDSRLSLLAAGADYRIPNKNGYDVILRLEQERAERESNGGPAFPTSDAKRLYDVLTAEGVNWDAARAALSDKGLMENLKNLPGDYKHRPWLPQRPTLRRPEE